MLPNFRLWSCCELKCNHRYSEGPNYVREQEVQFNGFIRLCAGGACETQARRKGILSIYALENVNDSTDNVR
jgi:hypothetical protein